MKYYLALFVLTIILINNVYSNHTKFDKEKFKTFLQNLKAGDSIRDINKSLNHINKEKNHNKSHKFDMTRFRFSQKHKLHHKSKLNETSNLAARYGMGMAPLFESWVKIKTDNFDNNNVQPTLNISEGSEGSVKYHTNKDDEMINEAFKKTPETDKLNIKDDKHFYVRINKRYTYFTNGPKSKSIIFFFDNKDMKETKNLHDENSCVEVVTFPNKLNGERYPKYTFCHPNRELATKFDCYLVNLRQDTDFKVCETKLGVGDLKKNLKIIKKKINHPIMIIPTPQRICNYQWSYENKGSDWECLCKEGKYQSPIDLPDPKKAVISPMQPMFDYYYFNEGDVKTKIEYVEEFNSLKILSANSADTSVSTKGFGKVVTQDGAVYFAEEVVFHVPSEHTIDGNRYPLEISIIHNAKSKGDFGKRVVLNFLFKPKAGIYNKFLDQLEFFNLPNPHEAKRTLHNRIYIPEMFYTVEDGVSVFKPFSFYTYQGSLTAPPCNENVIQYVVSEPIEASPTSLDMFKEALRRPDFEDNLGNVIVSEDSLMENSRMTQSLNGRAVFLYDSNLFNPSYDMTNEDEKYNAKREGHYEKLKKRVTNYFYVDGYENSEVKGAIVAPEDEALLN